MLYPPELQAHPIEGTIVARIGHYRQPSKNRQTGRKVEKSLFLQSAHETERWFAQRQIFAHFRKRGPSRR